MMRIQLGATQRGLLALQKLARLRSAKVYPHTAKAVEDLTKEAQSVLLRAVQGKVVSSNRAGTFKVNRVTGALHGAILGGLRYPYEGNALRGAIVIKHKHYLIVRDGIPAFDMKPGLLASAKAVTGKSGTRYLTVPIRVDPENRFSAVVFRIVSSKSKGWIHPGTVPRRLDLYVADVMAPKLKRRLREALARDMAED